ncbi:MAG: response regulator [Deltaproteobacteria bacterium]|nr:response regulator [Deltaproteobacteria bacterium]
MSVNRKILVVDDDLDLAESVAEILELQGYQASIAENGQEALRLFSREKYSLVLVDVKMPGISGVEVFLRMFQANKEIPVLLMSAFSEKDLLEQAVREGVSVVVPKPFNPEHILRMVDVLLKGKSGARLLVMDDDRDHLASTSEVLLSRGYRVDMALTGQEALKKAGSRNYDLLLLDFVLDDMTGGEALSRLRSQGVQAPVCFMTAFLEEMKKKTAALDMRDVLRKPFKPELLVSTVDEITGGENPGGKGS